MRALFAFVLVLVATYETPLASRAADLRFFDDASLRAIQFIDAKEGWAVGDEGVILHSIDGGQTWERQPTGTRASLRSVAFLDPFTGWAVGREELPGGMSVGVVLFTRDGGVAWKRLLAGALPGVNQVRFVSPQHGFLLTDAAEQFASGLYKTSDGGKSWEPVKGPRSAGWLGGDFSDPAKGILAGPWHSLMTVRQDVFGKAQLDAPGDFGTRHLTGVQILNKRVVAVGDGGLVLASVTGGAGWSVADTQLTKDVAACLDFRAICGLGDKAWVVGRPGSCVLYSSDAGATWTLQQTGQAAPLHGVFFLDEQKGWAVGDLGTILATRDGGKSWAAQRQTGKRAAALFVHARLEEAPLDAIALVGADDGYYTAVLGVTTADPATAALRRAADRARSTVALRQAGAVSADILWQFPLPQYLQGAAKEDILKHWHQGHKGRADRELLRQLVLHVRMWRPEVLVTDSAATAPGNLVAEALVEAVRQAGDATAFPEQLETLGLSPWQVKRLYAVADKDEGPVVHDNLQPRPRLEGSPREFAAAAGLVLHGRDALVPARRAFRLLHSSGAGADNSSNLLSGVSAPVGEARRPLDAEESMLAEAVRQRRHLLAIADTPQLSDQALAKIAPLLAQLADEDAAPTAYAVAQLYARRGQWDLAREAYLMLADRYPTHPLAAEAFRWLIRHNTSSELKRRYEMNQFFVVKDHDFHSTQPDRVRQAKATADDLKPLSLRDDVRPWRHGCFEFSKRLVLFGPLFSSDPAVQFPLQAAKRQQGDLTGPPQWFTRFQSHVGKGPWHDAAAAEVWLADRSAPAARRPAVCRLTDQRPHLDGDFDDLCWKGQKPLTFADAAGTTADAFPTQAMFAYDQEFLYVALRCLHPKGHHLPPVKARQRDADLEPYDRVSLLFDLDRDYATFYHMQVDQRGCVREDCCGDPTWDPKWFVACKSDETSWHIEAAIPLSELTGERIPLATAWACNLVRVVPGRGVQALSFPADVTPRPEGMCMLLFQQDAARAATPPMPKAP